MLAGNSLRSDGEIFVFGFFHVVRGAAVVAQHPQHGLPVGFVFRERPLFARHLGRHDVPRAGHQRGDGPGDGAAFLRIVGNAQNHEQRPQVGVPQAQRPVIVAFLGDGAAGELGHRHGDFKRQRPQPARVPEPLHIEHPGLRIVEPDQVEGSQVARGIVEKHVFRARIGSADASALGTRVPFVDGGVELQARVRRGPGGLVGQPPELPGGQALADTAIGPAIQFPFVIPLHRPHERVGQPNRVVGVLPGNGEVRFRVPADVVFLEFDVLDALLGELDDAENVVFRNEGLKSFGDRFLEPGIFPEIEPLGFRPIGGPAGLHHVFQVLPAEAAARGQGRHLALFLDFPFDELFHVGVVDVEGHHLGGAPGGAAGLDGAGGAVADLEEAHQAGGLAAAGQRLAGPPQVGKVAPAPRPVFEQPGLLTPELHDALVADQVVFDGEDETGVGLGPFVGGGRFLYPVSLRIEEIMALRRPVDAVGPVQPGVEPLRRVGRRHLAGQHVAHLVVVVPGVFLGIEVFVFPTPIGPAPGHAVEHLAGIGLPSIPVGFGQRVQSLLVRDRGAEPFRHIGLVFLFQTRRNTRLAKIFLRHDIHRNLRPELRNHHPAELGNDRAVRIGNAGNPLDEPDPTIRFLMILGEITGDAHD